MTFFYSSVANGLKPKVRNFGGLFSAFGKVTEGKLVGKSSCQLPLPILNRVNVRTGNPLLPRICYLQNSVRFSISHLRPAISIIPPENIKKLQVFGILLGMIKKIVDQKLVNLCQTNVFFISLLLLAGIYLLKVNNENTRTICEIYSKLTIKTPERRQ